MPIIVLNNPKTPRPIKLENLTSNAKKAWQVDAVRVSAAKSKHKVGRERKRVHTKSPKMLLPWKTLAYQHARCLRFDREVCAEASLKGLNLREIQLTDFRCLSLNPMLILTDLRPICQETRCNQRAINKRKRSTRWVWRFRKHWERLLSIDDRLRRPSQNWLEKGRSICKRRDSCNRFCKGLAFLETKAQHS